MKTKTDLCDLICPHLHEADSLIQPEPRPPPSVDSAVFEGMNPSGMKVL